MPLEYVDDTLGFHPEWISDKIAPQPVLLMTTDNDRLVLPQESELLYAHAKEPKRLAVLKGCGHYEVYTESVSGEITAATLGWHRQYVPAH